MTSLETPIDRSCGPSGCELQWLVSERHEVDDDVVSFTAWASRMGWGDGLPLIPPTEERVRDALARSGHFPDTLVAKLPPLNGECTVEKVAINAVMAGTAPEAMPLIIAAVRAMADSRFNLAGLNATTGSVVPAVIVNGPSRDALGIPYEVGCLGGVASAAPAIGRTIRLLMRNVAGQLAGVTSQSVFGSPGRVAGVIFGEWEEQSPWAPLAERRGVTGDAVTVYPAMGTTNICDTISSGADDLLEYVGRGLATPGSNGFLPSSPYCEAFVAFNPIWAQRVAEKYPRIQDVQTKLWEYASLDVDAFPPGYDDGLVLERRKGRRVHVAESPDEITVAVAGGMGNLHALSLPSWGDSVSVTRGIEWP